MKNTPEQEFFNFRRISQKSLNNVTTNDNYFSVKNKRNNVTGKSYRARMIFFFIKN